MNGFPHISFHHYVVITVTRASGKLGHSDSTYSTVMRENAFNHKGQYKLLPYFPKKIPTVFTCAQHFMFNLICSQFRRLLHSSSFFFYSEMPFQMSRCIKKSLVFEGNMKGIYIYIPFTYTIVIGLY